MTKFPSPRPLSIKIIAILHYIWAFFFSGAFGLST